MNVSAPFIRRPVATALLALGLALAGLAAYMALPIAPLPQVDIPTIVVWAGEPGADPVTTTASITAPLGAISGVTEITSSSSLGGAYNILQFDLLRSVDDAARDVQAAINAAGSDPPAGLPSPPGFEKFSPRAAPVLIMAVTSDTIAPRIVQVLGVSQVQIRGAEQPAIRVTIDPATAKAAGCPPTARHLRDTGPKPDEGVNGDPQQAVTRNPLARSRPEPKRTVISHMRRLAKSPQRVRSLCRHPTFRYAA